MTLTPQHPLLQSLRRFHPQADIDLVCLAYDFAEEAHRGQLRKSGEPYIRHPLAAAEKLAMMGLDEVLVSAALLHDVVEDAGIPLEDLRENFGGEITQLVEGVTKLGKLKYRGVERYMENLRRMFVSMAADVRVVLIKFADRMHNLETLQFLPPQKQHRIALESLEIYAPIANRLGMGELKGQIEDLAFPYVYAEEYRWLAGKIQPQIVERQHYLDGAMAEVRNLLNDNDIPPISIHGRNKHLYSLYKKLLRYNRDFERVHDLVAVRILVPTVRDCYAALGILHSAWKPLKDKIKDYIAQPKPNGYQSLHTTVFCKDGEIVEFQIRTPEMHDNAEFGIAAHWHYDEFGKPKTARTIVPREKLAWLDQLLKIQKEASSEAEALESMKLELFQNRIFVFTPTGDVIDLPEDSTPVDFAYHIHTDLGNRCVAAKINEKMQALHTKLQNGDVVEIIINKSRTRPNSDWLHFVKTTTARKHILDHVRKDRSSFAIPPRSSKELR